MSFLRLIQRKNTKRKISILRPFLPSRKGQVLDFGCGDLSLAKAIYQENPALSITGIDVVDFHAKLKNLRFKKYDGVTIPFADNYFDITLAFHVLHHCTSSLQLAAECCRVTRRRLIIVEPTVRHPLEVPVMRCIDYLLNIWKGQLIPFAYEFRTREAWHAFFAANNLRVVYEEDIEVFPRWVPTGRTFLFVVEKKKI